MKCPRLIRIEDCQLLGMMMCMKHFDEDISRPAEMRLYEYVHKHVKSQYLDCNGQLCPYNKEIHLKYD